MIVLLPLGFSRRGYFVRLAFCDRVRLTGRMPGGVRISYRNFRVVNNVPSPEWRKHWRTGIGEKPLGEQ